MSIMSSESTGSGVANDSAHNLRPSVALANTTSSLTASNEQEAARPTHASDPNANVAKRSASFAEISRSNESLPSNASGSLSHGGSKDNFRVSTSLSTSGAEVSASVEAEDVEVRRDVLAAFRISADYNFWTPDAYLQTFVKRLADGKSACEGLATLLAGRAALEKQVAALYTQWASKAHSFVSNCETRLCCFQLFVFYNAICTRTVDVRNIELCCAARERGSTRRLLQMLAEQADSAATAHKRLRADLRREFSGPIAVVRSFVAANYMKPASATSTPERFARAQRDWTRLFRQLEEKKRAYYAAVFELKVADAKRQFATATNTTRKTEGAEREKEEEHVARCAERRQVALAEYKRLLHLLSKLRHQYVDRMSQVHIPLTDSQNSSNKSIEH